MASSSIFLFSPKLPDFDYTNYNLVVIIEAKPYINFQNVCKLSINWNPIAQTLKTHHWKTKIMNLSMKMIGLTYLNICRGNLDYPRRKNISETIQTRNYRANEYLRFIYHSAFRIFHWPTAISRRRITYDHSNGVPQVRLVWLHHGWTTQIAQ